MTEENSAEVRALIRRIELFEEKTSESRKWRLVFWAAISLAAFGLIRGFDSSDFQKCIEKAAVTDCRSVWPFGWKFK